MLTISHSQINNLTAVNDPAYARRIPTALLHLYKPALKIKSTDKTQI
jgi:hypothetical protein